MSDREKKYEKLKEQLYQGFEWPSVYMFKFIIPADNKKLAKVEELFNTRGGYSANPSIPQGRFYQCYSKGNDDESGARD
ncbi:MAG: hypothetical protein U5L96_07525 [Owenweeksia sp.]|nr:hypothetical protein [Owenweeksia sp.]